MLAKRETGACLQFPDSVQNTLARVPAIGESRLRDGFALRRPFCSSSPPPPTNSGFAANFCRPASTPPPCLYKKTPWAAQCLLQLCLSEPWTARSPPSPVRSVVTVKTPHSHGTTGTLAMVQRSYSTSYNRPIGPMSPLLAEISPRPDIPAPERFQQKPAGQELGIGKVVDGQYPGVLDLVRCADTLLRNQLT